ncbi:MAG: transcriptional regulator [Candidatus Micrarchaeaceae archaeon]
MANGYQRASKEIVPAARLLIAKQLKERYNMSETNIAAVMGVAQAAVSKYLNGKYSKTVERISRELDARGMDKYIPSIAKGDQKELKSCICSLCHSVNSFGCKFSSFSEEAAKA